MKQFKQALSILIISFLYSLSAFAGGPGSIKGKVLDDKTGEPVVFANVWVEVGTQKIGAQTDFDGRFSIKPLDAGVYNLHMSYVGYQSKVLEQVRVSADKITFLNNLEMTKGVSIKEFTKTVYIKKLVNPEDPMAIPILAADIERIPNKINTTTMIASLAGSAVYQSDDGQPLIIRGSRPNSSVYFIDGVKVSEQSAQVPSSSIGEITVYLAGVPAKYGDCTSGVIAIETKNYFSEYNRLKAEAARRKTK